MKKILLLLLFTILTLPAKADDTLNTSRWYVGAHGNQSYSKMWDKKDVFNDDALERIDNGDAKAYSFSITGGIEIKRKLFDSTDNFKSVFGGEFFFDYINKTVVQGDKPRRISWVVWSRPMANKSVFKNKYIAGMRGKLGFRLFERADIYGHIGLAYWGRDWYLDRDNIYSKFYEDPDWKILPIYGLGGSIHITEHWAVNINYSIIRKSVSIGSDRNMVDYNYNEPEIGINILTVGVVYYF